MKTKLIYNDIKNHKCISLATCIFMAVTAMLFALTVSLFTGLLGSIDTLMLKAEAPDYLQMHAGKMQMEEIRSFFEKREDVERYQVNTFLNLENSELLLNGHSLQDSTQDNGVCIQSEGFDFLLDEQNLCPVVSEGTIYVPVCYKLEYQLKQGEMMQIGDESYQIAGFIRDSQMNSMLASSKRFLVSKTDYDYLCDQQAVEAQEYLIECRMKRGADVNVLASDYTDAGLPANGPTITYAMIRMMNALSDGMMIFIILLISVLIFLIALLCIRFILLTELAREQREIGMLKAIGIDKKKIRRLYFDKFLFLSFTGSLIGLVSGFLLNQPLGKQMQELYGASSSRMITVIYTILGVALIEGLMLLSIYRMLRCISRISALKALRKEGMKPKSGTILISIVLMLVTLLMIIPENIQNTLDSPQFITYMGIGNAELRFDIRRAQGIGEKGAELTERMERDDAVKNYVFLQTKSFRMQKQDGSYQHLTVELGDHTVFPVSYLRGKAPEMDDQIALSLLNAQDLQVDLGDVIVLEQNNQLIRLRVSGIYSDVTNGGKTAKACFTDNTGDPMWSILYATLQEGTDREAWIQNCQNQFDEQQAQLQITDVEKFAKGTYGTTVAKMKQASILAKIFSLLIMAVVLVLFIRLMVERDRYAIALQKALGFTSGRIRKTYFFNLMKYALCGMLAGEILGNSSGEWLTGQIMSSFGAAGFQFVFDLPVILVEIPVLIMAVMFLVMNIGLLEIRKVRAQEACRNEE